MIYVVDIARKFKENMDIRDNLKKKKEQKMQNWVNVHHDWYQVTGDPLTLQYFVILSWKKIIITNYCKYPELIFQKFKLYL